MPSQAIEKTAAPLHLRMSSREQLAHLLAEAAKLQHNLLCCYLYAAFTQKKVALSKSAFGLYGEATI